MAVGALVVALLSSCESAPLAPGPQFGAIVYGQVTRPDGAAVPGVTVAATIDPNGTCPAPNAFFGGAVLPVTTVTDASGEYRLTPSVHEVFDVQEGCILVRASESGPPDLDDLAVSSESVSFLPLEEEPLDSVRVDLVLPTSD